MKSKKHIKAPFNKREAKCLKAGDQVLFSGVIYTARDQAHLRLCNMLRAKKKIPIDLKGQVIYYCGPTPPGKRVIGSCGPTTASRMDGFTPELLGAGLSGMIGKGRRDEKVRKAIKRYSAIYFIAPGGAGAYLSDKVKSSKIVAFKDLGPEAIHELEVEDFPLVVGIDPNGKDIYTNKGGE